MCNNLTKPAAHASNICGFQSNNSPYPSRNYEFIMAKQGVQASTHKGWSHAKQCYIVAYVCVVI